MITRPLQEKSNAFNTLIEIINQLETICSLFRVCKIQADWGGEFQNNALKKEAKQRGYQLKETIPYHSETNMIIK